MRNWSPRSVLENLMEKFTISETFRKIILNTGWLFIDKIVRILFGVIVSIWVARFLGPEAFGTLNYAIAIFNLLIPLAGLGLESIIIRNLARTEESTPEILGTGYILKLGASILTFIVAIVLIWTTEYDTTIRWTVLIVCAGLIFHSFQVIDYWFQSQILSKFVVRARVGALFLTALLKIIFIILELSLIYFALAVLLETILFSIGLLIVYYKNRLSTRSWTFSWRLGKSNLQESWTLILAALPAAIYLRIDQVMLGKIVGPDEVGIYAVAVMIVESFYFIPVIIVSSILPALVRFQLHEPEKFNKSAIDYIKATTWISAIIISVSILFAREIFLLLYGEEYNESVPVFTVHILSLLSVFAGYFFSKLCIIINRTYINLFSAVSTAVLNVILNLYFIPRWGALGAAAATAISYTLRFIIPLLSNDIRSIFTQWKSVINPLLICSILIGMIFYFQSYPIIQFIIAALVVIISIIQVFNLFKEYVGSKNER
jgi:polysaccharide transporter, PST family